MRQGGWRDPADHRQRLHAPDPRSPRRRGHQPGARATGRQRVGPQMAARKKRCSAEVDALLEEMLVDANGDDEQLSALAEGIGDVLDFPLDVRVVGEPLSLLAVDYDGNARRGIVARCCREDGTEYGVSLADVELPPTAA